MTYSPTFGPAAQADPFSAQETHSLKVEFIMESHRVSGELRYSGPHRRVVDMLNAIDVGYAIVHDGVVDNAARPGEGARPFEVAQIRRDAILMAIPRSEAPAQGSSFESVKKIPMATTFVVPGYEVTGDMHMVAEADPVTTPVLASRHFTPVTSAVITRASDGLVFREEIVIVNLACTLFYAPKVSAG
jgi:hypothetical protein